MDIKKKTKKITVRFPKRLKFAMQTALIQSGYGLHGKSKWLNEAILHFLQQPNFIDFVEHGLDINQAELSEVEAFYIDINTIQLMKKAFLDIRTRFPLFEGVQSALIRAVVVHQLMLK